MTAWTDTFGGANIYPSEITYSEITLAANVTLNWPTEASASSDFVTSVIDVNATVAGCVITMPAANAAAPGITVLFNNIGANTFTVRNAGGTQIISSTSGTVWQTYLADNSTTAGTWRSFQYGASVSAAQASGLAGTGLIAIGAALSQTMPVSNFLVNYTAGNPDIGVVQNWTGSGTGTLTLPDPSVVYTSWFIVAKNSGGGALTVTPGGTATIDGSSTLTLQPYESCIIIQDGTDFYTIGFGQSGTFAFDYTTISVAGSGTYTLSGSELNRIAYNFTGVLTGNKIVEVPATIQQYWITNSTTGTYTLTVKLSGSTGIVINQGARGIYYSNGSDVVNADTGGLSIPISIASGGTGATTASAARTNLGGTSVGVALFTAVDAQAALAALGPISGGTF